MSIHGLFPIDKWDFKTESIVSTLPEQDYKLLMSNQQEHNYKKGDMLFREGSYAGGIFYIQKGRIKKFKTDEEKREHIIYVANKGELIGYHAILADGRYSDSASALEDSVVSLISKDDFLLALQQSSVLIQRLLKTLAHEFSVLTNNLSLFSQKTARERLALHLVVIREKYKENFKPGMLVEIDLSRDDLAHIVGTARENVVRILSDFKQEGIVETRGRKIIVLDVNKLISIANYK